jgi:two-component system, LytTR family, response regulator
MITAYVVDDELPAVERLSRMLDQSGRVDVVGTSTDPVGALADLSRLRPDVLFLDVRMPELSGFELLAELPDQPLVVFTTAHDEYALEAFQTHSIDYLLKPIDPEHLDRALTKAERFHAKGPRDHDIQNLLGQLAAQFNARPPGTWLARLASRCGDRIKVIDLRDVTHLYARDKLTFAATLERHYIIDQTLAELEEKLDPARFVRIHRGAILNLDHVFELHGGFGGRMVVRLKDTAMTELTVSRNRVRGLKDRLGL